jgi:hypothetical protein
VRARSSRLAEAWRRYSSARVSGRDRRPSARSTSTGTVPASRMRRRTQIPLLGRRGPGANRRGFQQLRRTHGAQMALAPELVVRPGTG